jgi:hypothetical protein
MGKNKGFWTSTDFFVIKAEGREGKIRHKLGVMSLLFVSKKGGEYLNATLLPLLIT